MGKTMKKRIGIGVVGAGSIGVRGALQHLCLPDVQESTRLAAVCDPVPGRAQAAAERFGVERAYECYEDMLADDAVEVITLCTPIGLHFEQGLAAIEAGKHVHFNKTMTTTASEATRLIDEAAQRGVKLVASPGQMLCPHNQWIRRLIHDGELGRLAWAVTGAAFGDYHEKESVRSEEGALGNINPAWYWRKPGGGPLYDMTVYGLHALTGILGPAKRVAGMSGSLIAEREFQGVPYTCDADDNSLMVLDFGENLFAFVYGTASGMVSPFGKPSFFGTKGSIVGTELNGKPIEYPGYKEAMVAKNHEFSLLPHVVGPHRDLAEAHVFEDLMQLVDWVGEGKPSICTAEHARHVIEIIEAGYRAAESGQTQSLTTTFSIPETIETA